MQTIVPLTPTHRRLLVTLEQQIQVATARRNDFLAAVLAGHDIEQGHVASVTDDGLVVETPAVESDAI